LAALERQKLLESAAADGSEPEASRLVVRLTEAGRLHALGGRDPESRWRRPWDRRWRLVLFDVPVAQGAARDRLRRHLRGRGFGYLQNSVWISPDPLEEEKAALTGVQLNVECLILLEARPCAGETDEEIVAGAWDFAEINQRYAEHMRVLAARPVGRAPNEAAALALRRWGAEERGAWLAAVSEDPLLPERLLPSGYLGREAWRRRVKALGQAGDLACSFHP
jgi:phenylacetic acid degradation operon negative regulatory protein